MIGTQNWIQYHNAISYQNKFIIFYSIIETIELQNKIACRYHSRCSTTGAKKIWEFVYIRTTTRANKKAKGAWTKRITNDADELIINLSCINALIGLFVYHFESSQW